MEERELEKEFMEEGEEDVREEKMERWDRLSVDDMSAVSWILCSLMRLESVVRIPECL